MLVLVGVLNDGALAGREYVAGDATGVEDADFAFEMALGDARVKLGRQAVVEEQAGAFCPRRSGGEADEGIEHAIERAVGGHLVRHVEQQLGDAQPAHGVVRRLSALPLALDRSPAVIRHRPSPTERAASRSSAAAGYFHHGSRGGAAARCRRAQSCRARSHRAARRSLP